MWWISSITLLFLGLFISFVAAQDPRPSVLCASSRFDDQCAQLQRGNSEVNCQRVQDSIDCAQRIRNGTADFGVFTAESALQLAALAWQDITVIKELRHRDRVNSPVDFESVVIVRADHANGLDGLRGARFCHPGLFYDRTQRWSERFLKHFERTVVPVSCENTNITSPAELEAHAMSEHFSEACRPGLWSNNILEDAQLKLKYPSLCSLCNSQPGNCTYDTDGFGSPHTQALNCLTQRGQVAYVSLEDARNYFIQQNPGIAGDYVFLCSNGTLQPIVDNTNPCVWLRQPWKLILSSNSAAVLLAQNINRWLQTSDTANWEFALREMLTVDSYITRDTVIQQPRDYFRPYRPVPLGQTLCSTLSTWCTSSLEEREKCDVIRAGGMTTGIYPLIECIEHTNGVIGCLGEVSSGRADFTGIDSNFGYLARHPYNLSTAAFAETEYDKYSSVVVVIKNSASYERFENLKNSKACIAEFSGIAAMAFINTGKNRGFFNKNECNYGRLLSDFFGSSCAPGARDFGHDLNGTNPESLCSLCRQTLAAIPPIIPITVPSIAREGISEDAEDESDVTTDTPIEGTDEETVPPLPLEDEFVERQNAPINCNADTTNRFYGNKGALSCLNEEGDVAILELQYLREHAAALNFNENDYRIICRNGSLAANPGFNIDNDCALTTIVDGEMVARKNSRKLAGIMNALSSYDKYFQTDPDFKMYNVFAGQKHLLFKDSTLGLVLPTEPKMNQHVENYKRLFEDLEICVQGSGTTSNSAGMTINILVLLILTCVLINLN